MYGVKILLAEKLNGPRTQHRNSNAFIVRCVSVLFIALLYRVGFPSMTVRCNSWAQQLFITSTSVVSKKVSLRLVCPSIVAVAPSLVATCWLLLWGDQSKVYFLRLSCVDWKFQYERVSAREPFSKRRQSHDLSPKSTFYSSVLFFFCGFSVVRISVTAILQQPTECIVDAKETDVYCMHISFLLMEYLFVHNCGSLF